MLTSISPQWKELKQLNGLDAAALNQKQLDEIPQHRLTTWLPGALVEDYDFSPAYRRACEAEYPSNFLSRKEGLLATAFTAEDRSLMSSVVYIRMGQNKVLMEQIEDVVRKEVRHRIDLEAFDIHPTLYPRKVVQSTTTNDPGEPRRVRSLKRPPRRSSKGHEKSSENQGAEDTESLPYKL